MTHTKAIDRGTKTAQYFVIANVRHPAVLVEGGFLTERGESKLIANKDWRAKLAGAISVGIENYQALPLKKQPPTLVADFRRQTKSAPVEPAVQKGSLKEADASIIDLVGRSAFLPPQQSSTPAQRSSLESAPIVP